MKKLLDTALMCVLFAALMGTFAFADVASGPQIAVSAGIPILIAAAAVVIIVLVVRAVRKKKAAPKDDKSDK
jgi:hypothetical protein